ncbi:MAG: RNA 2',3'-cyclic phosphodiesterase [Propionicimonas sp.]|uniref:RNA 2',3'-cyclic phosphodiesterase n=1 Tax=Propionicimonas sp. TaxID=1955623 RepID=UPI003D13E310
MTATGDRLFVAVLPPPAVVEGWEDFLEPRRDAEPGFRWTVAEGWHVTCAFMAAVPPLLVEPLEDALGEVAGRTRPFGVTVSGGGAFPDPDHAKALWLGVTDGAEPLARLATRCRNAATGCGIAVDGARFRPHLTIARSRPTRARRWLTILDAVPAATWTVEDLVLLRSRLLPGGAGYENLGRYPLTAG